MTTFADIKSNVKDNLQDYGVYFSTVDLNTAIQDAYDEIVCLTQCIVKKTTLNFQANLNYYNFLNQTDFPDIYVSDFMACTAIFSNLTNLWLLDDKTLKDFDTSRMDWELWTGAAVWWAPCNDAKRIAIVPKNITASGTFDLYYWATAPTVVDADIPLIPTDFFSLIESYATGKLLEIEREYKKASDWISEFYGLDSGEQNYDKGVFALAERTKNMAKSDLLMLG